MKDNLLKLQHIIAVIRTTAPKFAHYKRFSRHVLLHLVHALPEYIVDSYGVYGMYMQTGFVVSARALENKGAHTPLLKLLVRADNSEWHTELLHQLDIADTSDSLERMKDEESLYEELKLIEADVKMYESLIIRKRHETGKMVASLPVPKSAIARKEHTCWTQPSLKLMQAFPHTFQYKKEE